VEPGFPKGDAADIESRARSVHDACDIVVNLNGNRSSGGNQANVTMAAEPPRHSDPCLIRQFELATSQPSRCEEFQ